jgi:poly(3-hydroxybutyrate) depolymerase
MSHRLGGLVIRSAKLVSLASFAALLLARIASAATEQRREAVENFVKVDGISRKYLTFAPKGFDKPLPVVLAFHGGGSNARQMERYTLLNGYERGLDPDHPRGC